MSIPKIIHYCWFGTKEIPEMEQNCIASWRRVLPDYQIILWNEQNFDINSVSYVKEAYEQKKYAFVSDYVRMYALYNFGGIYFDTDVEVIRDMSAIVERGAFMGCEGSSVCNPGLGLAAAPGLGLAAAPGLGLYKELLDYYEHIHFNINGDMVETVVDHTTKLLKSHGWEGNGKIEEIADVYIYPPEYFSPMNCTTGRLNITENTYSIHWYTASWQSPYGRFKTKLQHIIGPEATGKIKKIKKNIFFQRKKGNGK